MGHECIQADIDRFTAGHNQATHGSTFTREDQEEQHNLKRGEQIVTEE